MNLHPQTESMVIQVLCFVFQMRNAAETHTCRSYSLQRRISSKLWRFNKYMFDPRWFHLMLAISRCSCFSYTRMERAEEARGTVDWKGWIEVFIFFLQNLLKESPFRGLWAHWIAEISGFPFYSLYFEISLLGVQLEMVSRNFFFPFLCCCVIH